MTMNNVRQKIEEFLADGIFLLDIKEDLRGKKLKLVIDSEEPVTIDMTTRVAKSIRAANLLDEFYPQGLSLEVSSPGIGSELLFPFQYRKNIGRSLTINSKKDDCTNCFQAKLKDVTGDGIIVLQNGQDIEKVAFTDIVKATLNISFT